ncbi:hypothetical protein IFR05_015737 [Cadophora sp. M221]|nr:hypothetical protein IFR05_015737 [Cadophora sp. M221]
MIDEPFLFDKSVNNSTLIVQIAPFFKLSSVRATTIMFLIVSLLFRKQISSNAGAFQLQIGTDPKSIGDEDDLQTKQLLEQIFFANEKFFGNEGKEGESIVFNSRSIQVIS